MSYIVILMSFTAIFTSIGYQWTNDLERLKHFIEEIVDIKGKWSSPVDGSMRFKSQCVLFQVTWYFKKQSTLLFQGELAEDLAVKLKEAITKAIEDAENLAKHDGASEVETSTLNTQENHSQRSQCLVPSESSRRMLNV